MKPCLVADCPALATVGAYCPVHRPTADVEPVTREDTQAAIDARKRIRRLYDVDRPEWEV